MKNQMLFAILICNLFFCQIHAQTAVPREQNCIEKALAEDDAIGKLRNHECKTISLSRTISNYTAGMKAIEMRNCPSAFKKAYSAHRKAWQKLVPITNKYSSLRGEMHDLFKQLERTKDSVVFKKRVAEVWSTWSAVEKASGQK